MKASSQDEDAFIFDWQYGTIFGTLSLPVGTLFVH